MNNKPKIVWEKWYSPFGEDDIYEQKILDEYLSEVDGDDSDDETTDATLLPEKNLILSKQLSNQKFMITPMGVMPVTENTESCKIFNFWTGHTNFDISTKVATIIERCDGVESLDIFTRYRFRISIGKVFKESEVMHDINKQALKHL